MADWVYLIVPAAGFLAAFFGAKVGDRLFDRLQERKDADARAEMRRHRESMREQSRRLSAELKRELATKPHAHAGGSRTIVVTQGQVAAARLSIKASELLGKPVPPGIRRIAEVGR